MSTGSAQRSSTVDHALSALLLFLGQDRITLKEICESASVSKTAGFRIAATLQDRGFLRRDGNRGYKMGLVFTQMIRKHYETRDIVATARPVLREVVERTQESAYISIRSGTDRYVILDGYESPQRIRWSGDRGEEAKIFAGSAGKVHLAFSDDKEIDRLLNGRTLTRYTAATITDPERLREEVVQIRRQGYAVSYGERFADAAGISAPVFGPDEQLVGVLSVFLPTARAMRIQELVDLTVAGGKRISLLMADD